MTPACESTYGLVGIALPTQLSARSADFIRGLRGAAT
jgi:hypothetical protein